MVGQEIKFDFEKLEVYKLALEFLSKLFKVYRSLPQEIKYSIGQNLVRAGVSISNNLAEGSGKKFKKEKARFYGTSLDSTRECVSMLNVLKRERFIDEGLNYQLRPEARDITGKIANLIESIEARAR